MISYINISYHQSNTCIEFLKLCYSVRSYIKKKLEVGLLISVNTEETY